LGQIFAWTVVAEPRLGAAVMGILGNGLGYDSCGVGTDAVWTGAPQWRSKACAPRDSRGHARRNTFQNRSGRRRDSPVKKRFSGGTNAKLYNYSPQQRSALENDRFAK